MTGGVKISVLHPKGKGRSKSEGTTSGKGQESLSLWTRHPRSIWEVGQERTDSQGSRPGLLQCTLVAGFWGNLIKFEW